MRILIIFFLAFVLYTKTMAQTTINLECDGKLNSTIQAGIFFNNYLYSCNSYYHLTHVKLKSCGLINIIDTVNFFIDDHNTWNLYAFTENDSCKIIIPDTLYEINDLVKKEPHLSRYDIAYMCTFFTAPLREIKFTTTKLFKKYTSKSILFLPFYDYNYYNAKLSMINRLTHSYVYHRDYYKLMHKLPNDTSMQLVLSLNRQEYSLVSKKIENKRFEIQNRFHGTSILVTVIFNKDNTVKEVRKQYFIPKTKKFKNKGMYFYDSLESLLANEQD